MTDVASSTWVAYKDLGTLIRPASTLKALELKPDDPTTLMNLGGIYKDLGDLDQALASTLKSLKLNPDNQHALINWGASTKISATLIRLSPLSSP